MWRGSPSPIAVTGGFRCLAPGLWNRACKHLSDTSFGFVIYTIYHVSNILHVYVCIYLRTSFKGIVTNILWKANDGLLQVAEVRNASSQRVLLTRLVCGASTVYITNRSSTGRRNDEQLHGHNTYRRHLNSVRRRWTRDYCSTEAKRKTIITVAYKVSVPWKLCAYSVK